MKSENEVVADVGMVIYAALDFGVAEDEQRVLSEELESIINLMVSSDDEDEVQDEGLGDETDDLEDNLAPSTPASPIADSTTNRRTNPPRRAKEGVSYHEDNCELESLLQSEYCKSGFRS